MSDEIKVSTRPIEVKCEGGCGYTVKWAEGYYFTEDRSDHYYGLYTKDELRSIVCLECYNKGSRLIRK